LGSFSETAVVDTDENISKAFGPLPVTATTAIEYNTAKALGPLASSHADILTAFG